MESFERQRNTRNDLAQKALSAAELLGKQPEERERIMRESAGDILELLRASGAIEYKNLNEMYAALRGEDMLVRREDPVRLAGAIFDNEPVRVDFPDGQRYSNAVEWNPGLESRGLQNAYMEGYGHFNNIVAVVGFKKTIDMDIESLPDASQVFAGLDRTYVRSVRGSYGRDDIIFVSLRMPATAVDERELTEQELDALEEYNERKKAGDAKNPVFVHRGYRFTGHSKKQ